MGLPGLRLSYLRTWACFPDVTRAARGLFAGKVIVLPEALGEAEREEIVDALAIFLDMPVRTLAWIEEASRGTLLVLPGAIEVEPTPVQNAVVVCSARRAGPRLDMPVEVMALRDLIVECWGREHTGTRLQQVAAWLGVATDSPGTALRFAGGALARYHSDPRAEDAALYAAGLAAAIGWLLRGVDPRVAQWVLVRAAKVPEHARKVGTEAALLGEDAALRRAFEAGLVHLLPVETGDPLDLRRPLEALGALEEAPGAPALATVAEALRACLVPEVHAVLARALEPARRPLGLERPRPPRSLVGREEVLQRLIALFEPAAEVRTTVLYGLAGIGKTTIAAALCELLASRLEPVWVRFTIGPADGWLQVAAALGIDLRRAGALMHDAELIPRWVREVHDRLRAWRYLVVIEDADRVPEDGLPPWLPAGPGSCGVLVLSERAERPLQRVHEAIAVRLHPLSAAASRRLLLDHAPHLAAAIDHGEADALIDRLGGHPAALALAAGLLDRMTLDEATAAVLQGEQTIPAVVRRAVDALDQEAGIMLRALSVCAREGSPPELARNFAVVTDAAGALDRLVDRSLVMYGVRTVRVQEIVRLEVRRRLHAAPVVLEDMKRRHAQAVLKLFLEAEQRADTTAQEDLYQNMRLALDRMINRLRSGDTSELHLVRDLCDALVGSPAWDRASTARRVIDGYRVVLANLAPDESPKIWANTQNGLGVALGRLRTGAIAENLRDAIAAFRAALTIFTREDNTSDWAAAQGNLGAALIEMPSGDKSENLRQAIDALTAALTVHTRDHSPDAWASIQNDLGRAYSELPTGNRTENLWKAIDAYRAALTVWTREEYPEQWALAQSNIGATFSDLGTEESGVRFVQAIEAYHAALTVCSRDRFPLRWAMVQNNLGSTLAQLTAGDVTENLRQAIDAYSAALTVLSPELTPWDWALAHSNLGEALTRLPTGDRGENLRDAANAFRAALTVYTRDRHPEQNQEIQSKLDRVLHDLSTLAISGADPAIPHA